jgi:transcriptional regulator with XRE-family HTH domain
MTTGTVAAPTVAELRAARGLSRDELAALAGVSPRTLYDLEHGLTRPQRSTATVLADALGCDPEDLRRLADA